MSSKKNKNKQAKQKVTEKTEDDFLQETIEQVKKEKKQQKGNQKEQSESGIWNYCIMVSLLALLVIVFGLRWYEEFYRKHGFMGQQKDLYSVLGIESNAETADIKKAHRELVKKWHPDRNQNCMGCAEKFQEITEAYDVLADPQKRAAYDSQIKLAIPIDSKTKFLTEEMLEGTEFLLIQILTNHCDQPCKALSPFWEHLSSLNELKCVKFVRVDGESPLAQKLPYKIKLYPSIIAYHRDLGSELYPYTFHYTQSDIAQFIKQSVPNVFQEVDKVNYETYFAQNMGNMHTITIILKTQITLCIKTDALKYKD